MLFNEKTISMDVYIIATGTENIKAYINFSSLKHYWLNIFHIITRVKMITLYLKKKTFYITHYLLILLSISKPCSQIIDIMYLISSTNGIKFKLSLF